MGNSKLKPGKSGKTEKTPEERRQLTKAVIGPHVGAATIIKSYAPCELQLHEILKVLESKHEEDDLSLCASLLMAQAQALNAMFNNLALKANRQEHLKPMETYTHLAMKAQNQCRQTVSALVEIANPRRAVFVKQQNIAHNQQVNNGEASQEISKNSGNQANELLSIEAIHGETLDFGGTAEAGGSNQAMATLEGIDRAEN